MWRQRGLVTAVRDSQALVTVARHSTCQSCTTRQVCGTATLAKLFSRKPHTIIVENTIEAEVGDTVTLIIEESTLLGAALLIYAAPLLTMLLTAIVATYCGGSEWQVTTAGLLGLLIGLAVASYKLRRPLHISLALAAEIVQWHHNTPIASPTTK